MDENEDDLDYNYEDEENGGFFRWLQIVVVLFALGGFFGLAWYAYKSGGSVDEKDVEIVKNEKAPVKEAPNNDNIQVPNQDKTVYNLINGGKNDKPVVERIMPATEEPVHHEGETGTWMNEKVKGEQKANNTDAAKAPPTNAPTVKEVAKNEKPAEQFNPAKAKETAPAAKPAPAPKTEAANASVLIKQAAAVPTDNASAPATKTAAVPAPTETPKIAESAPAPTAAMPKIRIQLAALTSEEEATNEWDKVAKKFTSEMSGKQHYVVKVTVKGKVYYRLQVAPFDSAQDAENFCVTLIGAGQGCFLAKGK